MPLASPRHSWLERDRVLLSILKIHFSVTLDEMAKIFSSICRSRLVKEGFDTGSISTSTIASQLHDLTHSGTGNELYCTIAALSHKGIRETYSKERDEIEDAAQILGIELKLRVSTHVQSKATSKRRRALSPYSDTRVAPALNWLEEKDQDDDEDQEYTPSRVAWKKFHDVQIPVTPSERQTVSTPSRVPLLLRSPYDSHGRKGRKHPVLLFRAFERSHEFMARRYLPSKSVSPPPPLNSQRFRTAVVPHLTVDKSYASPFISFAENPRNALKRINLNAHLDFAVFDYNEIECDATDRYGPESGPYLTSQICRIHNIHDLPRSNVRQMYTGTGEFLVWGAVRCRPIAELDTAQAMLLDRVMTNIRAIGGLDRISGERAGRCLDMVPDKYRELIAYKMVRSYAVPGYSTAPRSVAFQDFVEGVYNVSGGSRAASVMPQALSDASFDPNVPFSFADGSDFESSDPDEASPIPSLDERSFTSNETSEDTDREDRNSDNDGNDCYNDNYVNTDWTFVASSDSVADTPTPSSTESMISDTSDRRRSVSKVLDLQPGMLSRFRLQVQNFSNDDDEQDDGNDSDIRALSLTSGDRPGFDSTASTSGPRLDQSNVLNFDNVKNTSVIDLTMSDKESSVDIEKDDDSITVTHSRQCKRRRHRLLSIRSRSTGRV